MGRGTTFLNFPDPCTRISLIPSPSNHSFWTGSVKLEFDINVGGMARDWHIRVGKSSTPFYCHLGLKYGREFISLAVSNTVVTPRDSLSHLFDEEWMLVNDYEQKLLKRLGDFPLDLTSPFMYRKEG